MTDTENTTFVAATLKRVLRLLIWPVKHFVFRSRRVFAFIIRRSLPAIEKVMPPVGRKMRKWNWVWQPVFGHQHLNKFYEEKPDPFNFSSPYEIEKYAHSIRLLDGRNFEKALELGAAEGIFTEMLAPHCRSVLGIELADVAVERARARLAHLNNVSFLQATLPQEMPEGQFDLIVASDVLCYFPKDILQDILIRLEDALEPGGILFNLNYMGSFGMPTPGPEVHEFIKQRTQCEIVHEEFVEDVGPRGKGYAVLILKKNA